MQVKTPGLDAVLTGGVEMMRSSLRRFQRQAIARSTNPSDRFFAFARELFAHAEQHRDAFAAMVGKRSGSVFQRHLHQMLIDVVREDVAGLVSRKKRNSMDVEVVVQFVAGGLLGLLICWRDQMTNVSAGEMDERFRQLALPLAESLLN